MLVFKLSEELRKQFRLDSVCKGTILVYKALLVIFWKVSAVAQFAFARIHCVGMLSKSAVDGAVALTE